MLACLIDPLGEPSQNTSPIVRFGCQVDVTVLFVQLGWVPQPTKAVKIIHTEAKTWM